MIIDEGEIHSHLRVHALRLIGNACADTSMNFHSSERTQLTRCSQMKIERESFPRVH